MHRPFVYISDESFAKKCKVQYIGFLTAFLSTIFFFTSYRIEMVHKETWTVPLMKENSHDKHSFIPSNKGNETLLMVVDYREETARISHNGTRANDPYLIELIRKYWIRPPPTGPYKFKSTRTDYSTHGQSLVIDSTLKNKVSMMGEMIVLLGQTAICMQLKVHKRSWCCNYHIVSMAL